MNPRGLPIVNMRTLTYNGPAQAFISPPLQGIPRVHSSFLSPLQSPRTGGWMVCPGAKNLLERLVGRSGSQKAYAISGALRSASCDIV